MGQPVLVGNEAADAVAEALGQHRDDAVDQVGGVAALAGLAVEGTAGFYVVGNVGDVHGEFP